MATLNQHIDKERFWRFSVDFYQHQKVKSLCLAFQDNYQLNVNLLLFCAFLASDQARISRPLLTRLKDSIISLDEAIVRFRATRRQLKQKDLAAYQQALTQELTMEQNIQQRLIESYQTFILNTEANTHLPQLQVDSAIRYLLQDRIDQQAEHLIGQLVDALAQYRSQTTDAS